MADVAIILGAVGAIVAAIAKIISSILSARHKLVK